MRRMSESATVRVSSLVIREKTSRAKIVRALLADDELKELPLIPLQIVAHFSVDLRTAHFADSEQALGAALWLALHPVDRVGIHVFLSHGRLA